MPTPNNGPRPGKGSGRKRNTLANNASKQNPFPTPMLGPANATALGSERAMLQQTLFEQLASLRAQKGLVQGQFKMDVAGVKANERDAMVGAEENAIGRGILGDSADATARIGVTAEAAAGLAEARRTRGIGLLQHRQGRLQAFGDYTRGLFDIQARKAAAQAEMASDALLRDAVLRAGDESETGGMWGASPAGATGNRVVDLAMTQRGAPYVFGSLNPFGPGGGEGASFDCSGFAKWAVEKATGGRIILPHSAEQQAASLTKLSRSQLRPGDLVFFVYGRKGNAIDHVGIYVGNGKMIDTSSPSRRLGVRPVDWDNFVGGGLIAARGGGGGGGGGNAGGRPPGSQRH